MAKLDDWLIQNGFITNCGREYTKTIKDGTIKCYVFDDFIALNADDGHARIHYSVTIEHDQSIMYVDKYVKIWQTILIELDKLPK